MVPAKATRQQGLAPGEVSAHLLKRAGVVPDFSQKIEQLSPSSIWQILALDLFMGNSDVGFWGWSDPQCIYLLDYWYATDPAMHFIFVYDSLEHVLVRASEGRELAAEDINRLVNEWQCFYTALMHFYHRHRDRCLLVHAEQACTNPEGFDKALASRLQRPLERDASNSVVSMALDLLETSLASNLVHEQLPWRCAYEELQSQADFPLVSGKTSTALAAWNGFSALTTQIRLQGEALAASESRLIQTQHQLEAALAENSKLEIQLNGQQSEAEILLGQLHQVQEELERHFLENGSLKQEVNILTQGLAEAKLTSEDQRKALQRQLDEADATAKKAQNDRESIQAEKAKLEIQLNEQKSEAGLLLAQLHQIQEELECHFLENSSLKQEIDGLKQGLVEAKFSAESQKNALKNLLDDAKAAARKMQSDLEGEIKVLEQKAQQAQQALSVEMQQENELLLLQLHQVQEELERYYLENQRLKQRIAQLLSNQNIAKHPRRYYGAADRVKRQLSYRLGALMISRSNSFSGWLGMPTALLSEARRYKQDKLSREGEKLPPLSQYADLHEGERVKRHLSYRLGATLLANYRSPIGWVKLPWLMGQQVREFKRERAGK